MDYHILKEQDMSEIVNLGKVSMTMGGDLDSSKSYDKLTCVSHKGCSWASKKNVSAGIEPSAVSPVVTACLDKIKAHYA